MESINVKPGREKGERKINKRPGGDEGGGGGLSAAIHLSSLTRSESYRNAHIDNKPENTPLLLSPHPLHSAILPDVCHSHIWITHALLTLLSPHTCCSGKYGSQHK